MLARFHSACATALTRAPEDTRDTSRARERRLGQRAGRSPAQKVTPPRCAVGAGDELDAIGEVDGFLSAWTDTLHQVLGFASARAGQGKQQKRRPVEGGMLSSAAPQAALA